MYSVRVVHNTFTCRGLGQCCFFFPPSHCHTLICSCTHSLPLDKCYFSSPIDCSLWSAMFLFFLQDDGETSQEMECMCMHAMHTYAWVYDCARIVYTVQLWPCSYMYHDHQCCIYYSQLLFYANCLFLRS